jgi:CRP-like cAMP-binding protein
MLESIDTVFTNEIQVDAKSLLIERGVISNKMFLIKKGCVRIWYKDNGKEITTQLFMEGHIVASIESFLYNEPSVFNAETLETCQLAYITKNELDNYLSNNVILKESFYPILLHRVLNHSRKLLFLIRNKPEERYRALIEEYPDIINRIPHHYIASYLGMTTVSLSRIRGRK